MDENFKNSIALFRYGIIAPLVTSVSMTPEERGKFFRDASKKTYTLPDGSTRTYSSDTLYRYYKAYMNGGFDALKPNGRVDAGNSRKIDSDIASQIKHYHTEQPRLPSTLIYRALIDNGTITEKTISLSTVTRFVNRLKKEENFATKEMRRYEVEHINEVWYGDSSVGPYLKVGKRKRKYGL